MPVALMGFSPSEPFPPAKPWHLSMPATVLSFTPRARTGSFDTHRRPTRGSSGGDSSRSPPLVHQAPAFTAWHLAWSPYPTRRSVSRSRGDRCSPGVRASSGHCACRTWRRCFQRLSSLGLCRAGLHASTQGMRAARPGGPSEYLSVRRRAAGSHRRPALLRFPTSSRFSDVRSDASPGSWFRLGSRATSPRPVGPSSGCASAPAGAA
jgi:hypothetical protein